MTTLKDQINRFLSEYHAKNHEQVLKKAESLIEENPQDISVFQVIGVVFAQNSKFEDAIIIFKKLLDKDPQSIEALINIGLAYYELNKLDEAIEYLEKAKNLDVRQSEVFFNLGLVYEKNNNTTKALKHYKQSVEYDSSNIDALLNLGNIYLLNKNFENANNAYENALKLTSDDPIIYHNLGVTWTKVNKIDKAFKFYLKAKKLHSRNPLTYYNLGCLYLKNLDSKFSFSEIELSKLKEAELNFKKAIEIDSNTAKFFHNLAVVQSKLQKFNSAIGNYKQAIKINPNHIDAKYNLSRLYLTAENFEEGWSIYYKLRLNWQERVIRRPWYKDRIKNFTRLTQWSGEEFKGKLFVYGEQGIGDQILHSSILPDLHKKHPDISLSVDNRLISLFKRSFKYISVTQYGDNEDSSVNDRHIPLLSLGPFLRKSINDFKPSPYIIPSPEKVEYYKKILSKNQKIKIGLSWISASRIVMGKNISLNSLSKILTLENFEFINLQYNDTFEERKKFKSEFGTEIINIDNLDLKNDIEGLAALIANCDLFISISNTTAQLAGSLGTKSWILTPLYPHWEWFLNRNNSLWYPNVKLFRQTKYESWDDVIDNVYNELKKI